MLPVCVRCETEFRVKAVGVTVCEMAADLLECPTCGAQIVAQFGNGPYAEEWQDDFHLQLSQAKTVVYDYERPSSVKRGEAV